MNSDVIAPPTPSLVAVRPDGAHAVVATFADGQRRRFDLAPHLGLPAFAPLRDPAVFGAVALQGTWAIEWPGEIDIHRDTLYFDGEPL